MLKATLIVGLALLLGMGALWIAFSAGWLTQDEVAGDPVAVRRPVDVVQRRQIF